MSEDPGKKGRLQSFSKYYQKSAERLKLQGMPVCANYSKLNNLINGLTYVYFREITKPSEALMSKLEDKRIVDCLLAYAVKLCEEFVQVEKSLEQMIKGVYQHIDFRSLPKKFPSEQEQRAAFEQTASVVERLLMAVVDYYKLNLQALVHLLLKVRDKIETLEINVSNVILRRFLLSDPCNCFFGGLHILELIQVASQLVSAVTSTASTPWTPEELKTLEHHLIRCDILSAEVVRVRQQAIFRFLESPRHAIEQFELKHQTLAEGFEEKLSEAKSKQAIPALARNPKPKSVQGSILDELDKPQAGQREDLMKRFESKSQRNHLYTVKDELLADESHQLQERVVQEKQLENETGIPFFWIDSSSFCVHLGQPEELLETVSTPAKPRSEVQHLWAILARNFSFLVFYYGQMPVFWVSLKRMKVPSWLLGLIFSLTTLCSLVSNYLFNKHLSDRYRLSFTLSGAVLLLAIFLQVIASGFDNVPLLLLARVVAGFAEGLVTTDTYIVRVTPEDKKSYFGYLYIGSHALAISLGCGLAGLLDSLIPEFQLGSLKLNGTNYLSVFLFFFYVPGLLIFFACFSDPRRKPPKPAAQAAALPDAEALVQPDLDPYEFELSEIHELTMMPTVAVAQKTFDQAVLEERREVKRKELEEKIRYVKRYFLKDQTNYIAGFLFTMHTIHECAIIETPFVLTELKQLDPGNIGLFFFLIFPVLLCFSLGHWFLKHRLRAYEISNGNIFRYFLFSLFVACIIKFQFSKEAYPLGVIFLGSTLVLALSLGAESSALSVLTQLVSEHQIEKQYGVGFKKSMLVAGGRALAGVIVTISIAIYSKNPEQAPFINAIIYGIWVVGLPILYFRLRSVMNRMDQTRL